jgi:hypothetical protein
LKNSDGGIFANSKLGKYLQTHLDIPEDKELTGTSCLAPHVIAADAFPLKTYLKRPYPGSQSKGDKEKSIFNYRLSQAKRVMENGFRILSQKFKFIRGLYNHCRKMRTTLFMRLVFCIII